MRDIEIVRLGPDEGERLREVRLRALRDAPDAFGSSYAREIEFPPRKWAERLANQDSRWWVATRDGADAGLVCVRLEEGAAHLLSMWVAPEARKDGVGSRLVDEAVKWARTTGAEEIGLWAVDENHAARGLYARKGFTRSGKVMALPSNPALMESHYVLSLLFRRARRQDVPAIVAMLADDPLGAQREGDPGDERYLAAFDRIDADPYDELIVAERDGKVVGTMQLTYLAGLSRLGAERCQIEAVRVAASTRGQGLGRKMIAWAIDRARARGCAMVQLTSDRSRTDAHRFYDGLGFTASHVGYKLKLD
ncbi:GNAT superfamily N-acetyltransferase [Nonomuraea thailandensis]|uniref:GNAT superfamily N-acetyltransferase n=2 Tax=Nonomuraea thailandensis TaxID=1188745 RepID=A0A9X2GU21_9ACTN|nr:GNAT superfamily N-acetyltransferase [Nonomuraea thailandensis]